MHLTIPTLSFQPTVDPFNTHTLVNYQSYKTSTPSTNMYKFHKLYSLPVPCNFCNIHFAFSEVKEIGADVCLYV